MRPSSRARRSPSLVDESTARHVHQVRTALHARQQGAIEEVMRGGGGGRRDDDVIALLDQRATAAPMAPRPTRPSVLP